MIFKVGDIYETKRERREVVRLIKRLDGQVYR